ALGAVPFDQLVARESEQRRGRRQRETPEGGVLVLDRLVCGDEEFVAMVAQPLQEGAALFRGNSVAAELAARRLDRRGGAGEAQHQIAVPPGAGIERQR